MSEHLDVVASGGETIPSVAAPSVGGARPSLDAKLAGVFAPICTPFARDESVDDEALRSNLARYAGSGLLGYLALGSTGRTEACLRMSGCTCLMRSCATELQAR